MPTGWQFQAAARRDVHANTSHDEDALLQCCLLTQHGMLPNTKLWRYANLITKQLHLLAPPDAMLLKQSAKQPRAFGTLRGKGA